MSSTDSCRPAVTIRPRAIEGRLRLALRWARFAGRSLVRRNFDFLGNALRAELRLAGQSAADLLAPRRNVECNICGWRGRDFYPNTGPGYDERGTLCPGCRGLDRHRTLLALLTAQTDFFAPGKRILEVAPMRGFQAICQAQPGIDYTSFDLSRYAMERGDITDLRFEDREADFFVVFHVLEHIPDEAKALSEIRRVLKPGGSVVLQVPMDWDAATTREFGAPDPRDAFHVRQYGRDFPGRIAAHGFRVRRLDVEGELDADLIRRHGLSPDPIFLGARTD